MAYNRTFNPDSLPAFAEPERKTGKHENPPPSNYSTAPSGHTQAQQLAHQQYNKPQPLLPTQNRKSSQPPVPGGQRLSPQMPPQGNYGYGSSPPASSHGYASPPPASYGSRPPPAQQRPPPMSRPPPSPAPPSGGGDPALWPLFKAVDKDGSGQLSEKELRAALVNGDWSSFDPYTVRMMIRMFDSDRSGLIGFEEFCGLWGFLAAWRSLFDRFDADRSGNISLDEYTNALVAFGYRLSPQFVETLFRTYDKRGEGAISFDLFVQSCISLKRMTDVFKKYDDDRDGYITLSFEDFLTEIIRQK
ncbi:Programmed cell death protein [Lachnellula willkommii]|uniref:Programmed cell death protein n=1 Tax=Lachnellula willkommii TaxID=215461 RepID=A0A559M4P8_9HELO|nr:Programmed cell death protein [Lachnellula willkommii]